MIFGMRTQRPRPLDERAKSQPLFYLILSLKANEES